MPKFAWEGRTKDDKIVKGDIDADSLTDVENMLKSLQISPTTIKKKTRELKIALPSLRGINVKSLVIFVRQLATMIDAGLPLVQSLDILAAQEPDIRLQKVLEKVKLDVEAGSTFAESLKKHPKVFDMLFVNLVQAGEIGGILDTILNRLATYMEKSMQLKGKVKSAMKYPMFVLIAALLITAGLLWKVIPIFADMFKSMGNAELPALTQFMVSLSNNFIKMLPLIILSIGGLIFGFISFYKTKFGNRLVDAMMLKIPILGTVVRKAAIARFTRTMGTLLNSGVPILDALEVVARSSGNKIIEEGILYTKAKISEGKSIAGPLEETNLFPKMVVQMISVGESTGAMDVMLSKIADFYDDEVDSSVEAITSLIEPLIMIVIGGLVGTVLISMYLPIFQMADNLTKR
jgi:type IV pilus assembly protein PilC